MAKRKIPALEDALAEVRAEAEADGPGPSLKVREISNDEASVLAKLGLSGAEVNDKARRAMDYYLEGLVRKDSISDEQARSCLDVLRQSSTENQKRLCNKVLAKYVSKFEFAQPKKEAAIAA